MIYFIIILTITIATIYYPHRYFWNEKKKAEKYPFFKLRDELIYAITTMDNFKEYKCTYELVNDAIEYHKSFDFKFFFNLMTNHFGSIFEEGYQKAMNKNQSFIDPENQKIDELNEFDKRFILLVLKAARNNSLLLKIAMTKFGVWLLVTPLIVNCLIRFFRKHPELMPKLKVVRRYSVLSQSDLFFNKMSEV